jgi:hypothetical protein
MNLNKYYFRDALFIAIVLVLSINKNSLSQDSSKSLLSFELGGDVVSRYIWRGCEQDLPASSPHIQPYGSISANISEQSSFALSIWGSYGLTGGYSENDFTLCYNLESSFGSFIASVTDYYFPNLSIPFSNFNNDTSGAHTLEAAFSYVGAESFPFRFLISQNFHGIDAGSHSLYFEAGFITSLGDYSLDFFLGIAKGNSSWYRINTEKFELINVGITAQKYVKITQELSVPIGISFILNPYLKTTYLVLKVSI